MFYTCSPRVTSDTLAMQQEIKPLFDSIRLAFLHRAALVSGYICARHCSHVIARDVADQL
ncbi:hypothetical protein BCV70DRAFT_198639 [Testicularia cyperi]|uniref:Uncharacterized protein n=1 Tax=Testicularia cyperi TaxID=1882483 RepID=A0A317XVM9_9BASI|nr:hypothetical protein BCV70DRAFT_198639 [Testicularia cyperi]